MNELKKTFMSCNNNKKIELIKLINIRLKNK